MSIPDIYDLDNFNIPRTIKKYIVKKDCIEIYNDHIMTDCIKLTEDNKIENLSKIFKENKKYISEYQYLESARRDIAGLQKAYVVYKYNITDMYISLISSDEIIYEMNYNLPKSIKYIHTLLNNGTHSLFEYPANGMFVNLIKIYTKKEMFPPTYINVDKMKFIKQIKFGKDIIAYFNIYKWNDCVVIILSDIYYNNDSYNFIKYNIKRIDFDDNTIQNLKYIFISEDIFVSLPELDCYEYCITYRYWY